MVISIEPGVLWFGEQHGGEAAVHHQYEGAGDDGRGKYRVGGQVRGGVVGGLRGGDAKGDAGDGIEQSVDIGEAAHGAGFAEKSNAYSDEQ